MPEIKLQKRVKYAGDVHLALMNAGVDSLTAFRLLESVPDADAEPVKHGRWEFVNLAKSYLEAPCGDTLRCSVCNFVVDVSEQTPYCPNCGAKMDQEVDHGKVD